MMKIIVKLQLEPDEVKEVFEGNNLSVTRTGTDVTPILIVRDLDSNTILGEFAAWACWVVGGVPDQFKDAFTKLKKAFHSIEEIIDNKTLTPEERLQKIIGILYENDS